MSIRPLLALRPLSDGELLGQLKSLVQKERAITLAVLLRLVEVERRGLHARRYSSLFAYCTDRLRYSPSAAVRRIRAARCLRDFPRVYDMLLDGRINLSTLCIVSRVLTSANEAELLARVSGKSQDEVERIVAALSEPVKPRDRIRPIRYRMNTGGIAGTGEGGGAGTSAGGNAANSTGGDAGSTSGRAADSTGTEPAQAPAAGETTGDGGGRAAAFNTGIGMGTGVPSASEVNADAVGTANARTTANAGACAADARTTACARAGAVNARTTANAGAGAENARPTANAGAGTANARTTACAGAGTANATPTANAGAGAENATLTANAGPGAANVVRAANAGAGAGDRNDSASGTDSAAADSAPAGPNGTEPGCATSTAAQQSAVPLAEPVLHYRIELTVDASFMAKLDRARTLVSRGRPGASLSDVLGRALDEFLQRQEPELRMARRQQLLERRQKAMEPGHKLSVQIATASTTASTVGPDSSSQPNSSPFKPGRESGSISRSGHSKPSERARKLNARRSAEAARVVAARAESARAEAARAESARAESARAEAAERRPRPSIPAALRDFIWHRDGGRCTYHGSDGRCPETRGLQIDHIRPVGLGGCTVADNLRLLCARHNQCEADRAYGRHFMDLHRLRTPAAGVRVQSRPGTPPESAPAPPS